MAQTAAAPSLGPNAGSSHQRRRQSFPGMGRALSWAKRSRNL